MIERVAAASLRDLDALMALMDVSFPPEFGEGWTRAQLAGSLVGDTSSVYLASSDGGDLGFSLCRNAGIEVELLLIGVTPAARGTGVGGRLIDAAVSDARAKGAEEMFLEVRANNAAAQRLYRSRAFHEVGRRVNYYAGTGGLRFDAITMRRILRPLDMVQSANR